MSKVRCRYAPSPTGSFHIGGCWMGFFNYLYAKHFDGDFILRSEDTDISRNIEGGFEAQLDGLEWLGIVPDESPRNPGLYGPYVQSGKFERFTQKGKELLEQGKAYYCFCTSEELDKMREEQEKNSVKIGYDGRCENLTKEQIDEKIAAGIKPCIRLKMPKTGNIEWDDMVRGHMCVPVDSLSDPVIVKSNGIPTYNFAVVLDDHEMQITNVLRGSEHIANTPYQIAIMRALGYDDKQISFGHLTIIVDETGKKLSKRNKDLKQFILSVDGDDYIHIGYHPKGILNFISLLGWSPKDNNEFFTVDELIKQFDGTRLSTSPAFFDVKKMNFFSNYYIKNDEDSIYLHNVKKFIKFDTELLGDKLDFVLLMFKQNLNFYSEINDYVFNMFYSYNFDLLNDEVKALLTSEPFKKNVQALKKALDEFGTISLENANEIVNKVKEYSGLKGKELFMPIRLVAIAKEHGPEMNKILYVIGREKMLENISKYFGNLI